MSTCVTSKPGACLVIRPGFDVTYLPYNGGGKPYVNALRHLSDDLGKAPPEHLRSTARGLRSSTVKSSAKHTP